MKVISLASKNQTTTNTTFDKYVKLIEPCCHRSVLFVWRCFVLATISLYRENIA